MADTPTDPRFPPGDEVDFDSILDRLIQLKNDHFPQHTARDRADPYIQLLVLAASLGQHALGRMNQALKQLSPKSATSRRALIAILEIVNRPLRPIQPARGFIRSTLKSAPIADTELIPVGARIAPTGVVDPIFTVDEAISTAASVAFAMLFYDDTDQTFAALAFAASQSMELNDALVFVFPELPYDAVDVVFNTPLTAGLSVVVEYRNEEVFVPDAIVKEATTLRHIIPTWGNTLSVGVSPVPIGARVTVTHKPSRLSEEIIIEEDGSNPIARTSFFGQADPSVAPQDYEISSDWRMVADLALVENTAALSVDGTVSYVISSMFSETNLWIIDDDLGGYAIRVRITEDTLANLPESLDVASLANADGDYYAIAQITQGERKTITLGQTDGTLFQFMPIPNEPIDEPVADPKLVITVGSETDWFVVDDFSNSGNTSRHAIFREDVDQGFGIIFGDGAIGELPTSGESVGLTLRTGSLEPGDLDANTDIKALAGISLVENFILPRPTLGYEVKEASTRDSVIRFRFEVLPQLALRAQSAITSPEIITALTGGAPNRATFTTEDGRTPFSRALFSTTGVGVRQYRVVVVGEESDPDGTVVTSDLTEAENYLNGQQVGVEIVGGAGPNNTEAILSSFSARRLLPGVTITISDQEGIRDIADQIIREVISPHARDEDGEFRWAYGGNMPVAVLFGLLWDAIPDRVLIDVAYLDTTSFVLFSLADVVDLDEFELPVLDRDLYDPELSIVLLDPP